MKVYFSEIEFALFRAELVTFVARHPRLSRYNIYVTMFYKVLKTFFFFLAWSVEPTLILMMMMGHLNL